jgi:hypothetical protein
MAMTLRLFQHHPILTTYFSNIHCNTPAQAEDFSSSLCVQNSSEAHPASYPMGKGSPFLGVKRSHGMMLTTHPHLQPRSRMSRTYTPLPLSACMVSSWTALLYTNYLLLRIPTEIFRKAFSSKFCMYCLYFLLLNLSYMTRSL